MKLCDIFENNEKFLQWRKHREMSKTKKIPKLGIVNQYQIEKHMDANKKTHDWKFKEQTLNRTVYICKICNKTKIVDYKGRRKTN